LQLKIMLKQQLLQALASIDGLTAEPSPVSGGTALFYQGREFAHFHNDNELDLRLTKKVIQAEGLAHPAGSTYHPSRSASSPWIEVRFSTRSEVDRTTELVKLAISQL
jgi:hypothetical protein